MDEPRRPTFVEALRASPRKRRRLMWLGSILVVLAVAAAVVLIVPNTGGQPHRTGTGTPAQPDHSGKFWTVFGIILICFFLALLYGVVRVVWRVVRGDIEAAGSDGDTWRNPQRDLERALRSGSE